jgi:hypothetical protein
MSNRLGWVGFTSKSGRMGWNGLFLVLKAAVRYTPDSSVAAAEHVAVAGAVAECAQCRP